MRLRRRAAIRCARVGRSARHDGFTIVELVMVIVILAILGALAGPRFFDTDAFNERGYADEFTAALRYAQKIAVASGCPVRVTVSATSYTLRQQAAAAGHCNTADNSFAVPVTMSSGDTADGSAPANVTTAPSRILTFDALGRTDMAADETFTIGGHNVTLEAGSGLVLRP